MSGAIPPLPQYDFMAWCSVKAQEHLYFYLYCQDTLISHSQVTIFPRHVQGGERILWAGLVYKSGHRLMKLHLR
jgi:hypothetical protein